MSNSKFKSIALLSRPDTKEIDSVLLSLIHYLTERKYRWVLEKETAKSIDNLPSNTSIQSKAHLNQHADIIVVVGGDGSLLYGAQIAIDQKLPILGINRGYLGFLADIHPQDTQLLDQVLQGNYQKEKRSLLSVSIEKDRKLLHQDIALNEMVLLPANAAHMMKFDLYINEEYICCQRADGLLVATPTGSTAYALSAGGPILHPQLGAFLLIPMFPHTLSSRPLVINEVDRVAVQAQPNGQMRLFVSCDGREQIELPRDGMLHIKKHHDSLELIHPVNYRYFATLRAKLGWHGI